MVVYLSLDKRFDNLCNKILLSFVACFTLISSQWNKKWQTWWHIIICNKLIKLLKEKGYAIIYLGFICSSSWQIFLKFSSQFESYFLLVFWNFSELSPLSQFSSRLSLSNLRFFTSKLSCCHWTLHFSSCSEGSSMRPSRISSTVVATAAEACSASCLDFSQYGVVNSFLLIRSTQLKVLSSLFSF